MKNLLKIDRAYTHHIHRAYIPGQFGRRSQEERDAEITQWDTQARIMKFKRKKCYVTQVNERRAS